MKPKMGREIVLLMVPVLVISGVAWWQTRAPRDLAARFSIKNPFDPGPMRVEFSPLKIVEPKPIDVARGYDWAAETTVTTPGKWDVPTGWRMAMHNEGWPVKVKLIYRQGTLWKNVSDKNGNLPLTTANLNASTNLTTLKVSLKDVPRDADEVRVRGEFGAQIYYAGAVPRGWKPPKNLRITGKARILTLPAKPFDARIKRPDEPFPVANVSRVPEIELVDARWFTEPYTNGPKERFVLHLRRIDGRDWGKHGGTIENIHVFDADSRELPMYANNGTGVKTSPESTAWLNQDNFNQQKLSSDMIEPLFYNDVGPKGGWGKVKQPIRLEMEVGNGKSWPLRVRVHLKHDPFFDQRKFGAPDARFKPAGE
jgi:hypothetical protein